MIVRNNPAASVWGALALSLILLVSATGPLPAQTPDEAQAIAQLQVFNKAFTAIARSVTPTVVTITTRHTAKQRNARVPDFAHPFFNPRFRFENPEPREYGGLGSGIIVSEDGYILTNNHVAGGGAEEITVILSDNREFEAKLVGADSLTDVAVIKVDAQGLRAAKIGNSDRIQIGEWVLAVGAPLELQSTVTAGIVSATGRNLDIIQDRDHYDIEDFIQTDAAINKGNSGGALVNLNGQVIGVNTAIASQSGGFVGYGFAIPINLAKKTMDDIIAYGRVRRGYLGIGMSPVTADAAYAFGLDRPRGVLVGQVMAGAPAESAGLKSGDIILKVDGREVNRGNHIQNLIARKHPGDAVALEIRREDKTFTLQVKLGERAPDAHTAATSPRSPKSDDTAEEMGLTVRDMTPELAQSFGLEADTEGVAVVDVDRGPAARAGFRPGDVIFKVRQRRIIQNIRTVKDFRSALNRLEKGQPAAFSVLKGGNPMFLTIKIPE